MPNDSAKYLWWYKPNFLFRSHSFLHAEGKSENIHKRENKHVQDGFGQNQFIFKH